MTAATACRALAEYIDRSGPASSRFLRHVAGCLRAVPRAHRMRAAQLYETILRGEARPLELLAFVAALETPC